MKKILTALILLFVGTVKAQTFRPDPNTKSSFTDRPAYLLDTIGTSSLSKQQLYSNALNFVTSRFTDSRNVVEVKDTELGEIAFHGNTSMPFIGTLTDKRGRESKYKDVARLYFKCNVYVKDNKFKVILSALKAPLSSIIDSEGAQLTIKPPLPGEKDNDYNKYGRELAVSLIKDISEALNRKPESDF